MNPDKDRQCLQLADDHVMIGEIVKPHGIQGEIKVYTYSEQPENFRNYTRVVLQEPTGGRTETYRIVNCRAQGKLAILRLKDVTSREKAEALQGWTMWLNKEDFQKLGPNEYYWHQLEGMLVITESGRELGRVGSLFHAPSHDIMVLTGMGQEYLIPVTADIVRSIDTKEGKITISPPAGLLDINK